MKYRPLGRTGELVSELCLGSMTWGSQNDQAEADAQMDMAVGVGINIIDTAELYPTTPSSADTAGDTERIIGDWLARSGKRDQLLLATKVCGAGNRTVRNGDPITPKVMIEAVEDSLRRLRTDRIDLYQFHWPNRGSYHFRQSWKYDPSGQDRTGTREHLLEMLETSQQLIDAGKIRYLGVSNETCWGTTTLVQLAEQHGLPRMVSIQNEYSLMHRLFDTDLAEMAHHEQVGLLAFSPLAAGALSGKYRSGDVPAGCRRAMQDSLNGRYTPANIPVYEKYFAIADKYDLHPAQLALAFCLTRPFMTSVIIGATDMAQLRINLAAADLTLSDEILADIAAVHRAHPIPM